MFNVFATNQDEKSVRSQLEQLNKFWQLANVAYPVLDQNIALIGDKLLIQMHLSLVEKTLRAKNVQNLSQEQQINRLKCLDILNDYRHDGKFPKNLHHEKRTPYFIDDFGTACAVGQLIINTGNEDFAHKISDENNYSYIHELNQKYSSLGAWADKNGFTIEELAWIQPCYCLPAGAPGTTINITCNGGYDGSFVVDPSNDNLPSPLQYGPYYIWSNANQWEMLMCGPCDLGQGNYKQDITDGIGELHEYFVTITEPTPWVVTSTSSVDDGSCIATAALNVAGNNPPYSYSWTQIGQSTASVSGLCSGVYDVVITDINGCNRNEQVTVQQPVLVEENAITPFKVYPNPSKGIIYISAINGGIIKVINVNGQLISSAVITSENQYKIDLSGQPSGQYFVSCLDKQGNARKVSFLVE